MVWGEPSDAEGHTLCCLRTANGFDITVNASQGIVERLLDGPNPAGGNYAPSKLMGADYVLTRPGVRLG